MEGQLLPPPAHPPPCRTSGDAVREQSWGPVPPAHREPAGGLWSWGRSCRASQPLGEPHSGSFLCGCPCEPLEDPEIWSFHLSWYTRRPLTSTCRVPGTILKQLMCYRPIASDNGPRRDSVIILRLFRGRLKPRSVASPVPDFTASRRAEVHSQEARWQTGCQHRAVGPQPLSGSCSLSVGSRLREGMKSAPRTGFSIF